MASDAVVLSTDDPWGDQFDFVLDPEEVARGSRAVTHLLETMKPADARRLTAEALDTLALLITGGVRDAAEFPWQQVRSHHQAAVLTLLKEAGTPALVEKFRCARDSSRKYHQAPESYPAPKVQKLRSALQRIVRECSQLGLVPEDEADAKAGMSRARILSDGEYRALAFACDVDDGPQGPRDALILYLGYHGGLRVSELVRLTLEDLHFEAARQQMTVVVRPTKNERRRRVPLGNEALIVLEDWLEQRGREDGALFCPVLRGRIERRRMTSDDLREVLSKRADQAGVSPFTPNDLRRRATATTPTRRRKPKRKGSLANGAAALYNMPEAEDTDAAERLRFPYRPRAQQTP